MIVPGTTAGDGVVPGSHGLEEELSGERPDPGERLQFFRSAADVLSECWHASPGGRSRDAGKRLGPADRRE
jgi:hypothetical protein